MMHKSLAIASFLVVSSQAFGQQAHELPFASSGNTLELAVVNTSAAVTRNIRIVCSQSPSWIQLPQKEQRIALLKGGEEFFAVFMFSVEKTAPVNTPQTLTFTVTGGNGERWTKEVKILVAPPVEFELFQNYPNPFNPSTTISYQLPQEAKVNLRIYDLLGREVATLVDGQKTAGYHEERWVASRFASGMYVYQLVLTDRLNKRQVFRKTMMLVK